MRALIDFLVWCGMKDVVAKALLSFMGMVFVVAPVITGACGIYFQITQFAGKMDTVIMQQAIQTSTNNALEVQINVLNDSLHLYQKQTTLDIVNLSKVFEKTSIATIDIMKLYQKVPVNMPLIQYKEQEVKVFMEENLPHKPGKIEYRLKPSITTTQ